MYHGLLSSSAYISQWALSLNFNRQEHRSISEWQLGVFIYLGRLAFHSFNTNYYKITIQRTLIIKIKAQLLTLIFQISNFAHTIRSSIRSKLLPHISMIFLIVLDAMEGDDDSSNLKNIACPYHHLSPQIIFICFSQRTLLSITMYQVGIFVRLFVNFIYDQFIPYWLDARYFY